MDKIFDKMDEMRYGSSTSGFGLRGPRRNAGSDLFYRAEFFCYLFESALRDISHLSNKAFRADRANLRQTYPGNPMVMFYSNVVRVEFLL